MEKSVKNKIFTHKFVLTLKLVMSWETDRNGE